MAQRDQDIIPGVSVKTRLSKPGILVREIAFDAEINQSTDRMVVGPNCGNKRCPHASDPNSACTGSDAPDQQGSIY